MPDIREVLERAAPPISKFPTHDVRRRARRRRVVPRAAVASVLAAALIVGIALFTSRGTDHRNITTAPSPTSTSVAPPTTTVGIPGYVDPRPTDPALSAAAPRCTADDLALLRARGDAIALAIFLTVDVSEPCALLSYPTLEGLTSDGSWLEIPVYYANSEAMSSFVWEGVVDPAISSVHPVPVAFSINNVRPESLGGTCPDGAVEPRHYTDLRLVLRERGGMVDLPGVPFDTGGCATVLGKFGYDHFGS